MKKKKRDRRKKQQKKRDRELFFSFFIFFLFIFSFLLSYPLGDGLAFLEKSIRRRIVTQFHLSPFFDLNQF